MTAAQFLAGLRRTLAEIIQLVPASRAGYHDRLWHDVNDSAGVLADVDTATQP